MIYAKVGDAAMVYTGDYNMTPDRHLGAAQIDHLKLDLLITEYCLISPIMNMFSYLIVAFTWTFNLVLYCCERAVLDTFLSYVLSSLGDYVLSFDIIIF
jgi:hypothetical protein